jgi:hypothetical protein
MRLMRWSGALPRHCGDAKLKSLQVMVVTCCRAVPAQDNGRQSSRYNVLIWAHTITILPV